MKNKKLGLYHNSFLVRMIDDFNTFVDLSRYPAQGDLVYYKNRICRILEYNKHRMQVLQLISSNPYDCIELNEQETSYIKQLCTKYNLEEPECNLQTLNNLVLIDNQYLLEILPNITELAASNDEGTIIITTMILLNHDSTIEQ